MTTSKFETGIVPEERAQELKSIAYVLTIDDDKHYIRQNQPCYGELRKYESTHRGDCTQPANPKPTDLHHPFPEGTPTGLVVPFHSYLETLYPELAEGEANDLFETMYSVDSPWARGFGKEVSFVKKNNSIVAVKFSDLALDSTILVNSLKVMQNLIMKVRDFNELLTMGMDRYEALLVLMLNGISLKLGVSSTDSYSVNPSFSFRRFFERNPNDLTGGYLSERVDYNRTNMADVFKGGNNNWYNIAKERLPIYGKRPYSSTDFPENFVKTVKDIIAEAIDKEEAPVTEKYIWTTTSGRTNG
jgi:hypothetical protein